MVMILKRVRKKVFVARVLYFISKLDQAEIKKGQIPVGNERREKREVKKRITRCPSCASH